MPQRSLEAREPVARAKRPAASFAAGVRFRLGGADDVPAAAAVINEAYLREAWLLPPPRITEAGLYEELRDGQLLMNRRGGFAVAEQLDLIPGVVIANPEGFGFLKPDDGADDSAAGNDLSAIRGSFFRRIADRGLAVRSRLDCRRPCGPRSGSRSSRRTRHPLRRPVA